MLWEYYNSFIDIISIDCITSLRSKRRWSRVNTRSVNLVNIAVIRLDRKAGVYQFRSCCGEVPNPVVGRIWAEMINDNFFKIQSKFTISSRISFLCLVRVMPTNSTNPFIIGCRKKVLHVLRDLHRPWANTYRVVTE